jgi:hypothetical protein
MRPWPAALRVLISLDITRSALQHKVMGRSQHSCGLAAALRVFSQPEYHAVGPKQIWTAQTFMRCLHACSAQPDLRRAVQRKKIWGAQTFMRWRGAARVQPPEFHAVGLQQKYETPTFMR